MVVPFMTLYLTQSKNYSIGMAGTVMALMGAGSICGGILGGRLTDRLGFYTIQLTSLFIGGILFIVLGQMEQYWSICLCGFVLALLNDMFRPANATAVAHYSKEENRTRSFSVNRLSINLGWALGGALGGIIASKNYHLLFWIDGLTNIGAALLLRSVLSPSKNSLTPPKKDFKQKVKVQTHSAYRDGKYIVFILMTVLFGGIFFQNFSTLPVYYSQQLHFSPSFIGLVMAMNGLLIALFEMAIVFKLEQRRNIIYYITIGTLLTGVSFVIFNLLPGSYMLAIVSTFIMTVGEMLAMPFMNTYWVSRTNNDNRGQYAGLYTVAWSAAQVLGPFCGTQIVEHTNFRTLWWVVGGVSIIAALGFRSLQRDHK
ncbi:MAG: major facilitator superfamily 1 [Flavipsychrobacter sp.]|jgi:predicted MFS family arabinose efflux permease|nr:major facilitator superfamily 1 [Flavipsychrobacter sp.]